MTHNTELSLYRYISLYEKLLTRQNLLYLKQSLGEIPGEDCRLLSTIRCEQWNRVTGFAVPGSLFDTLLTVIAHSDLLPVSHDDAAEATDVCFLHFFFLV